MAGRKPMLSICRTCREPQMGSKFHRDATGARHDSCIVCEDKAAEARARRKKSWFVDYYVKYFKKTTT